MKFRSVIKHLITYNDTTMTKKAVFVRKMRRAYNNQNNREHSRFTGYPEGTYYGYESFDEMKKDLLKEFLWYYGKGLKKLRLERC